MLEIKPKIGISLSLRKPLSWDTLYILILACTLPILLFLLQGRIGLNLSDEGYIWYGVEEVIHHGAVPMLDFRAYDPGRYYWSAAWSVLFGDGLIAFRLSSLVMEIIGLAAGLLSLGTVLKNRWLILFAAVMLTVWMLPRHKLVESSFAMMNVAAATWLIHNPTRRRYFFQGLIVGLTAFLGRNLGLYAALGSLIVLLYTHFKVSGSGLKTLAGNVLVWIGGIIVGYLPMLIMILLIPGFANAFWDSILFWFRQDETNITLPVMWPWLISFRVISLWAIARLAAGFVFLIAPFFFLGSLLAGFVSSVHDGHKKARALLVSASAIGIFFLHHAFSRADIAHLGQSIHPFLLGAVALPLAFPFKPRLLRFLMVSTGLFLVYITISIWGASVFMNYLTNASNYTLFELDGQQLIIPKDQRDYLNAVETFVKEQVHPDEATLIIPNEAGLYPIIGQSSPIWDTYLLWRSTDVEQDKVIQQLNDKNVNWIILNDAPVDNREDFRLSVIYPKLWDYIHTEYEAAPQITLPEHSVLKRR